MKKLLQTILGTTFALSLLGAATPAALAADNVVMVELFTSQGCSSCPPADQNLGKLTGREDVLPLSMHVDYWDYLGWRDTFASRDHTERQYAYRSYMGARVVYTPQVIVHGAEDVPGYRPDLIETAVGEARAQPRNASIVIDDAGGMLKANITMSEDPGRCTIWIATYEKSASVKIGRGENAGETITYHNVVENLLRVGTWPAGGGPESIELPQPGAGEGVAIWLQDDRTGRVLTASFREN